MTFDCPTTTAISASGSLTSSIMLATSLATSALDLRGAGPGGRPGTSPVASRPKLITFGLDCSGGSPCDGNGSTGMNLGVLWAGRGGGGTRPCPGKGGGMSCPASRAGGGDGGHGAAAPVLAREMEEACLARLPGQARATEASGWRPRV